DVNGDDIDQVNRPALELRSGGAGAVGDALHLFEELAIEAAQEQGIGDGSRQLPSLAGRLRTLRGGVAANVAGDLRRQEPAMLHAALIRFAFDVQDDPASLRIAIAGS